MADTEILKEILDQLQRMDRKLADIEKHGRHLVDIHDLQKGVSEHLRNISDATQHIVDEWHDRKK